MMKRRAYLIVALGAIAVLVMWQPARAALNYIRTARQVTVHYGTVQERQATTDAATALKSSRLDDPTVLFRVDGETVTVGQYNRVKALLGVQRKYQRKSAPSDSDVRAELIKMAVLYAKAKSAGVYPTETEITDYVAQVRNQVTAAGNYDQFTEFVSGLGITEDEYWAAPWVREEQTNSLVAERVRDLVAKTITAQPGETADQLTQRRVQAFRAWWDQQVSQAMVSAN